LYVDTNRHVECVVEKPQIGDFYNIRERQISRSSFSCLEWTELLMLTHDKIPGQFSFTGMLQLQGTQTNSS